MNEVLQKIIAKKKKDLGERKRRLPLEELRRQIKEGKGGDLFYQAIARSINDPAVIAEVKFGSPSGGDMGSSKDLLKRVKQYEASGADAISIITEPHFFKGSVDFIGRVKEVVKLPILQKDFVIDEYQIYESARKGADALLLISRLLNKKTLEQFVELCLVEGVESVVEVYSEEDLEKAVATKTRLIAVNSRDLDTFDVDVKRACRILKEIHPNPPLEKEGIIRLGFSGIRSREEVVKYREAGARGVLIGTSLMKAKNIGEFLREIMSHRK